MLTNCWNDCFSSLPFKKGNDIEDDACEKLFNTTILQQTIPINMGTTF